MFKLTELLKTHKLKSKLDYISEEIHRSARFGYNFGIFIFEYKLAQDKKSVNKKSDNTDDSTKESQGTLGAAKALSNEINFPLRRIIVPRIISIKIEMVLAINLDVSIPR